ncbi:hypothetical protein BH160DRAFT_6938 [Burkholderia sp. H160]|nr:hypothetical protein BH160DRAFT_6938 [Burkholderia sp. H160]
MRFGWNESVDGFAANGRFPQRAEVALLLTIWAQTSSGRNWPHWVPQPGTPLAPLHLMQ